MLLSLPETLISAEEELSLEVLGCPGLTGLSLLPGRTRPSPFHLPKELATTGHILRAPQVAASYCTYALATSYDVPQVGAL